MREVGVDISGLPQRTPLDIELFSFDLVITLGEFDQACRPNLPGMPPHLHWDVPEPDPTDLEQDALESLRRARDLLGKRIDTLFESGMLQALLVTRRNLELVLDNLLDGVMAHTDGAADLLFQPGGGTDHRIPAGGDPRQRLSRGLPGRFCGGTCSFCEGGHPEPGTTRSEVPFVRPDGAETTARDGDHADGR